MIHQGSIATQRTVSSACTARWNVTATSNSSVSVTLIPTCASGLCRASPAPHIQFPLLYGADAARLFLPNHRWQFVQCQNFGSLDKIGTLEVARQCAKAIGRDWDEDRGLRSCAEGKRGRALLRESVRLGQHMNLEK
jgi:hypothetical protein